MIFDYIRLRRLGLRHKTAADATNLDELIRTVKAGVSIIAALLALLALAFARGARGARPAAGSSGRRGAAARRCSSRAGSPLPAAAGCRT